MNADSSPKAQSNRAAPEPASDNSPTIDIMSTFLRPGADGQEVTRALPLTELIPAPLMAAIRLMLLIFLFSLPAQSLDLFEISQATFVGANVGDVVTSWGKLEGNPLWPGRVGTRHAVVKAAVVLTLLVVERKFKGQLGKPFTVVNFALGASLTGVSIRNARQARWQ